MPLLLAGVAGLGQAMDLRALDALAWDAADHEGPCQKGMKDHVKRIKGSRQKE